MSTGLPVTVVDAAPPLPASVLLHFLVGLGTLLFAAKALGVLARRVRMPSVVGELAAGVALGPSLLGSLLPGVSKWLFPRDAAQMFMLEGVAQLGVLLLVAFTGTHLDRGFVRRRARTAATISMFGLVIPLAMGAGLGVLVADRVAGTTPAGDLAPIFLGIAMGVTAIPVIAKTLDDLDLLHRDVGQLTLTAGMVDDAIGWLLLATVSAVAVAGFSLQHISLSVLAMSLVVLLAALVGRPLARRGLRAAHGSPGRYAATCVLAVVGGAALSHALHLEAIFGAFVAGIVLASADPEIHRRGEPVRLVTMSVLAPLFLATAGLRVDLTQLADSDIAVVAAASLIVAVVGKFAGALLGARLTGLSNWEGLALGAGMNARGVVQIIVALTGLRLGVIDDAGYTVIVGVAVVTSVMAPPLLEFAARRIAVTDEERVRRTALAG